MYTVQENSKLFFFLWSHTKKFRSKVQIGALNRKKLKKNYLEVADLCSVE
jgi:hypothetical protein